MSSTALKLLALITLLLALGLGYVAYRMSQNMTAPAEATVVETREEKQLAYTMAVVAVKPILAHQAIEEGQVELVPVSVLPGHYFKNKEEVLGKRPLVDVNTGTTLSGRLFSESNVLSKSIPDGHRAMSLEIDDVIAVGGFVQPGDIVDALLFIRAQGKEVDDSQARLLLEQAMVLAYEEHILPEPEAEAEEAVTGQTPRQRQRRQRTVVLAVPEKETIKVMLGASIGEVRLALHGHRDEAEQGEMITAAEEDKTVKQDGIPTVTLRELSEIKEKKAKAQQRRVAPRTYVYRGNEVETVRH